MRLSLDGRIDACAEPAGTPCEPVRACIASGATLRSGDPYLAHKTSWRPHHDAAAAYARSRGCFDAILCNERGDVADGARTSLFVERAGKLLTPTLEAGVLPGILRACLLRQGRTREARLTVDDVTTAPALFAGNSARGLLRAEPV